MVRMFIRHQVDDFDAWKDAYDEFDEERREMGVEDDAVFQAVNDPEDVTVWHDFEDQDAARSFLDSPRLREVMTSAGVVGEPDIWFATRA